MVGDFLIESRCRRGHQSSATFRNYTREHVENAARVLSDRCPFPHAEDEECGTRVAHVIMALGSLPSLPAARPKRSDTKPSMGKVEAPRPSVSRVEVLDDNGQPARVMVSSPGRSEPPSTQDPD